MIPRGVDSFTLGRFRFHFRVLEEITFPPFVGAVLRGWFGKALRRISCLPQWDRPCASCLLTDDCAYSYLFETPNTQKRHILDGVSHAPHPFVLRPPVSDHTSYRAGGAFETEIVLVGKAVALLPRVVWAMKNLGAYEGNEERRTLALEFVEAYTARGWERIYNGMDDTLHKLSWELAANHLIAPMDGNGITHVQLNLLTPLRIKVGGFLTDTVSFQVIVKNLVRRIYLLDQWHCGGKMVIDHKALIALTEEITTLREDLRWIDWRRYSFRQEAELKMGGLVGTVAFTGPLEPFMPYLRLGELVHVGKGTAFGLGMYRLAARPDSPDR